MPEQVILEFIGDTTGLKPVGDALTAQQTQFKKLNDEAQKSLNAQSTGVKQLTAEEKKLTDQTSKAALENKKFADTFRDLSKTIIEGAFETIVDDFKAMGNEMVQTTEKSKSLKVQLKELKADLAALELAGDDSSEKFIEMSVNAAKLEDQIGDTNQRIRQLASDTRTFDLVAEGVRGITAAFSVAQGAAALFGEENEGVQKALLKVQGAMALATGAQELATIATAKGGIATTAATAAQATYAVVVGTSTGAMKAFRIALAGTGIGLAVLAVAELVIHWDELNAKVREFLGLQKAQASKEEVAAKIEQVKQIQKLYDDELAIKKASGTATKEFELQRVNDLRNILTNIGEAYKTNTEFVKFQLGLQQELAEKQAALEKAINDERRKNLGDTMKDQIKVMRETDALLESALFESEDHLKQFIDNVSAQRDDIDEPLITEKTVTQNKTNADQMAADLAAAFKKAQTDKQLYDQALLGLQDSLLNAAATLQQAFMNLSSQLFDNETKALEEQKEKQLKAAGDNADKRAAIEKKFAIEHAKIERQKAIAEKVSALFSIGVKTAESALAIKAQAAVLSSNPATAALAGLAYAQLGLLIAAAVVEAGVIAAKPLPSVPGFFKGTTKAPPGFKWVGEKGPELINDAGGYAIMTHPDSMKLMQKYQIPALPDNASFSMPVINDNIMQTYQSTATNIDYRRMARSFAEELSNNPMLHVNIDKNGITVHSIEKGRRVEHLNNLYNGD